MPRVPSRPGQFKRSAIHVAVPGTCWDPYLVMRRLRRIESRPRWLGLVDGPRLCDAFRGAILHHAEAPISAVVSGHTEDGSAIEGPHLAFLPLLRLMRSGPRIVGLAVALPTALPHRQRTAISLLVSRVSELWLGRLGRWSLGPIASVGEGLRQSEWTGGTCGARTWATVTPIAFDRHPKSKSEQAQRRELSDSLSDWCVRINLPRPTAVTVGARSVLPGIPPAGAFPLLERDNAGPCRHLHATITFPYPIRGPVLLGAGRYKGYGVCKVVEGGGDSHHGE